MAAPDAWAVDYLSGDKLRTTVNGAKLDFLRPDKKIRRWSYGTNGRFIEFTYHEPKKIEVTEFGKWRIENETDVCVQSERTEDKTFCHRYADENGVLRQYTTTGVLMPYPMAIVGQ
jgi:hypothetical protein